MVKFSFVVVWTGGMGVNRLESRITFWKLLLALLSLAVSTTNLFTGGSYLKGKKTKQK